MSSDLLFYTVNIRGMSLPGPSNSWFGGISLLFSLLFFCVFFLISGDFLAFFVCFSWFWGISLLFFFLAFFCVFVLIWGDFLAFFFPCFFCFCVFLLSFPRILGDESPCFFGWVFLAVFSKQEKQGLEGQGMQTSLGKWYGATRTRVPVRSQSTQAMITGCPSS